MRTGYECVMSVPADMHIVMVQALHECTQSPNPCGICEWNVLQCQQKHGAGLVVIVQMSVSFRGTQLK